jgi:adenylate kinase
MDELNLILLGPPGAGKGTQAVRLSKDLGLPHVATGDLLRDHRARGTELGRLAAGHMAAGRLVPDKLVSAMVLDRIDGTGFVLDGFPRTLRQAVALGATLKAAGRRVSAALQIDVPDDVLLERIAGRDDARDDDEPETVRHRLRVYHDLTAPLVAYYRARGLLRRVDGVRPVGDVYAQIRQSIDAVADPAI